MSKFDVMKWLLFNSGPIIRFRTMTDLLASNDIQEVSKAIEDVLSSQMVEQWLPQLNNGIGFEDIHSSNPESIENTLYKLGQLGMKAGFQPFDSHTLAYRVWLSDRISSPAVSFHEQLMRTIMAASLANAGYGNISPVQAVLKSRLETIARFVSSFDSKNIYADSSEYEIPKARSNWKLINPVLYRESSFPLPWIHDLVGVAKVQDFRNDSSSVRKINSVCKAILRDEYQELPTGYGLVREHGRYYVSGWSVHLPYFERFTDGKGDSHDMLDGAKLLLWLELLSPLPVICQSDWFQNAVLFLEIYRTRYDTYIFPREWLREKGSGYWINGAYMAFQRGGRNRKVIECESTFRMLKLKHQARLSRASGVS
ncbi:hypothetical protein EU537_07310 [Candidatus Thorarchaeota archaeon]|nr:MAG: hypothetical protein EU537_07310 [Candidatus Thorarchaeota archaeon]